MSTKLLNYFSSFFSFSILVTTASAQDLPPLIEQEWLFPGFIAISQGDPSRATASEIAVDALHALQAIADHPANCIGTKGTVVQFATTTQNVTTNGFGVEVDRETNQFNSELNVRSEFALWVENNIRFLNSNPLSGVNNGVREMISAKGCHSDEFKRLQNGLAAVFNVSLSAEQIPEMLTGDWQAFVLTCFPASMNAMAAQGYNVGERSMALSCVCSEYSARQAGDSEFYEAMRIADWNRFETKPVGYDDTFLTCYRERQPEDIAARYESFIRENGL